MDSTIKHSLGDINEINRVVIELAKLNEFICFNHFGEAGDPSPEIINERLSLCTASEINLAIKYLIRYSQYRTEGIERLTR